MRSLSRLALVFAGSLVAAALAAPAAPAATISRVVEMVHYDDPTGEGCAHYFMCDQPTGFYLTVLTAAQGERNDATVTAEEGGIAIRDAGAPLTLGPDSGCTLRDERTALCPADRRVSMLLFDGDDRASIAPGLSVLERIDGGPGDDTLAGRVLDGGDGNDVLTGTAADDSLAGGAGSDMLRGLAGRDALDGGTGSDVLLGGPGNDALEARDRRPDVVDGGRGRDVAHADPRDVVRSAKRARPR